MCPVVLFISMYYYDIILCSCSVVNMYKYTDSQHCTAWGKQ